MSLETTAALAALVPPHATLISESGIQTREDVEFLQRNGAKGVLIGETFMRRANVGDAVHDLMGPILQAAEPNNNAKGTT
ncbi:indole-3-glycerol-phosphate synthase [compost metagenome]